MSEYVNFEKFCRIFLRIPPTIVRLMVDRSVKIDSLPFIRGIQLKTFNNPDPLAWQINIDSTRHLMRAIEKLSKEELDEIQRKIKVMNSNDKPKTVDRKILVAYNGLDINIFAWFDRFGHQQWKGNNVPTDTRPTSLLFTHIYEYDSGRKISDHCWCQTKWQDGHTIKPGNYIRATVRATTYQRDEEVSPEEYLESIQDISKSASIYKNVVKGGIGMVKMIEVLTMKQAKEWKDRIKHKRGL